MLGTTTVFGAPATCTVPVADGRTNCQPVGPVIAYAYVPFDSENTIDDGATALCVVRFSVTFHSDPDGSPASVNVTAYWGDAPGDPALGEPPDGRTVTPAAVPTVKPPPIDARISAEITNARPRKLRGVGRDPMRNATPASQMYLLAPPFACGT